MRNLFSLAVDRPLSDSDDTKPPTQNTDGCHALPPLHFLTGAAVIKSHKRKENLVSGRKIARPKIKC